MGGDEYALAFQSLQLQPLALLENRRISMRLTAGRLRVERGNGDRPALTGPLVGDAGQASPSPKRAAARLGHLLAHEGAQTVELDRASPARRRSLTQHFGGRLLEAPRAPSSCQSRPCRAASGRPQLRMHASRSEPSPSSALRADGLTGRFGRIRDARGRNSDTTSLSARRRSSACASTNAPVICTEDGAFLARLARGNAGQPLVDPQSAANRLVGAEQTPFPAVSPDKGGAPRRPAGGRHD